MKESNNQIHPTPSTECSVLMSTNDLPLIIYNRSGPKSSQELLYQAASESDQNIAKIKWEAFTEQVRKDYIRRTEITRLIQNLDEEKQWSALHHAVANNNHYVARILLTKTADDMDNLYKCDINILNGNGENVLHVAAQSNTLWNSKNDQSQTLVRSYSTVGNINGKYESTSLDQSIPLVVQMLFEQNASKTNIHINHEDDEGRTPLHIAVAANRNVFVSYLLRHGADVEAKTTMNANIFHFVFIPSDPIQTAEDLKEMLDLLDKVTDGKDKLNLVQSRTLDNRTPLVLAVGHPNSTEEIVERLIEKTNFNQLAVAFDFAAKRPKINLRLLQPLLRCYDRATMIQKNELIQIACCHNHVAMLQWLVSNENMIETLNTKNYAGYTPLSTAVFYEAKDCFMYLLEKPNINWTVQNDDDETLLHISAKDRKKRDFFKMIWSKMKSEKIEEILKIKDNANNTPLHNAAGSKELDKWKHLFEMTDDEIEPPFELSQVRTIIGEKNAVGQTAVHIACEMGYEDIVKYFWDNNDNNCKREFFRRNADRKTCLHLAAANGHLNVVKYLVEQVKMEVDTVANRQKTPLHLACQYGHLHVVEYLLEQKASFILRDRQLYNCLEIAIMNRQDELVKKVLLEHPLWRDMMRNAQKIKGTKAYDTPMRKFVRYMPQVAIHVIETKLIRTVGGPDQKVFKKIYDYEFFQNELDVEQWYSQGTTLDPPSDTFSDRYKKLTWSETLRCAFCCFYCSHEDKNESSIKRYTDNSYTLVRNHPLFIVAQQSSCPDLVHHAYNINLRDKKFNMFGIYLLLFYCLLYTTYLGIFTALVLQGKHPQYFYDLVNVNYSEDLGTCELVSNTLVDTNVSEAFKSSSYKVLRLVAFIFLGAFILKTAVLFISLFPKILRMGAHYLEISVLILSFVYILDWYDWLNPVIFRCPVQHQIGSFALLLAWINFLTYVRCIPIAGIGVYVVMLQLILFKFVLFVPVLLIIICGFGFSYWMLLQNQSVYSTPIQAVIRTGLMMFDLGYEDRLYNQDQGGVVYYMILYVMFILTGIVLCIFVVNLMISVAVGEIPSLKDQSIAWRHQIMYDLLSDYEILRIQLRPIVNSFICGSLDRYRRQGPSVFKCLQRRQDVMMQEDENDVFWLLHCGHYMRQHFFKEQIQDNVEIPVRKNEKE